MKLKRLFTYVVLIFIMSVLLMSADIDWVRGAHDSDYFEDGAVSALIASSIDDGTTDGDWYNPETLVRDGYNWGIFSTYPKTGTNIVEWLILELKEDRDINYLYVRWNGSNYPLKFRVATSPDLDNWTQFGSDIDNTPDQVSMVVNEFSFTTVSHRFIRIKMLTNNADRYTINEIHIMDKE